MFQKDYTRIQFVAQSSCWLDAMHNKAFTKPAKRFVVTVTCDISTTQFLDEKGKDKLELFLKEILESYNGTEFHLHAIPICHTEQNYE